MLCIVTEEHLTWFLKSFVHCRTGWRQSSWYHGQATNVGAGTTLCVRQQSSEKKPQKEKDVECLQSTVSNTANLYFIESQFVLLPLDGRTSICCTVRSRKVFSLRTLIRLLGPLQPILVPRPPFSFTTTSLLRLSATLFGRPRAAILS